MVAMSNITLSNEEKQKIGELVQTAPELVIRRARLILAYAEGQPTLQAARQAGISRGRARYWKRQFLSRGMGIFTLSPVVEAWEGEPDKRLYAIGENLFSSDILVTKVEVEKQGEEEIPFPTPLPAIGIYADDSLAQAGKKVWLYHFALMISHEQGTMQGEDIEELHDMRVATRRMRTAFDIFGPAFEPKIMKHYLKGLRGIGRALGQVRDMDVILEKGLAYQKSSDEQIHSGLNPLLDDWKKAVDKKRIKLSRHLQSDEYEDFKRSFNQFLHAPVHDPLPPNIGNETTNQIRDIVPMLVYSRYAAVRAYDTVLPIATVVQLHELRIEIKKFRYTLEYFREILDNAAGKAINELKQYQDHLGELHDADVGCQLVKTFLKKWEENQVQQPINERANPEPIVSYLAYLHAERYRLMVQFPALWQRFSRPEFRHNLAQSISSL